ncbi:MAG TPA: fatty acid desaturase [Ilumatobacteraceae bacterium]|jgi:fatty acid desaturase
MRTELADTVATDTTLPRFVVPAEIRQWGARMRLAERSTPRAVAMLLETIALYAGCVLFGEAVDTFWGWVVAWIGLTMCMMRIDAVHHEAIHRSLFRRRWPNDVVASISGAVEGFHGPTYRCFHLTHHALTRRDADPTDPEGFYDEVLTQPHRLGPLHITARGALVGGVLIGGVTFVVQLTVNAVATLMGRPPAYVRAASLERHVRRWGALAFLLWVGVVAIAVISGRSDELLRWWVVPMLWFLCGPYTFFALPEHCAAPHNNPMVTSTGTVRSNALYRWLTLDGNYHLAHHVFPTASWWRLDEADAKLRNLTGLRYSGYLAFYRALWRRLGAGTSTASDSAEPAMSGRTHRHVAVSDRRGRRDGRRLPAAKG